jgi:hypothetical protein
MNKAKWRLAHEFNYAAVWLTAEIRGLPIWPRRPLQRTLGKA